MVCKDFWEENVPSRGAAGTGATGAATLVDFEVWVRCTRPEDKRQQLTFPGDYF